MAAVTDVSAPRKSRRSPSLPKAPAPRGAALIAFLVLGVIGLGAYAINWDFLSGSRLTLYQTTCRGEIFDDGCDGGWEQLPPTTFLVSFDQQSVVKQVAGLPPQRLQNCTVVNKRNWRCTVAGQVSEGFTDGEYELVHEESGGSTPIVLDGTQYVPRYEWLWAHRPSAPHEP